ncbi:MAG: cyclic beta-1,2-glucan ABC transporter [Alphaproteobacteria bacterium 64-6]|nr:MAG: cyclic beta-1,2-glucan ABC transporter [Hyphomicrobium sp. SCN 65-11]OJU20792.1 MAG: cyclic beta-1,2-glucan ABC transporter [Alphaproteobacteria bacterium 64-6]
MSIVTTYRRALGLLAPERGLAGSLVAANVAIGVILLAEPILFGRVVDALSQGAGAFSLIGLWAALGLFGILAGMVVALAADRLAHRRRLIAMATAFDQAITLPISYHARKGSGAVIRAIQQGTDCLFGLWLAFMRDHLAALVSIALLIPTALTIDVRMAALLFGLGAVYLAANMFVFKRTIDQQGEVERYHRELAGRVGDVLGNVTVVQSYVRFEAESQALRGLMRELLAAQYPVLSWWAGVMVLTRAASTITMVAIFALGALLVQRGELTVGQVVSFVAFANLLITRLDALSHFFLGLFQQKPAIDAYFDLVDTTSPVLDRPGARALEQPRGHVRYEDLTFRFPDGTIGVKDANFEALPGETVALVGHTGAGKTTALALLQRLRDPQEGRITIDGHDVRDVTLASLRSSVAVVFQDAGLFNRTIAENIRIGKPGATDEEVKRAAELAGAHDFIMRKQGGYDFLIGERGTALSGGERQRLAIARAILKDAPILILDEATSALDAETEARIKRALDALRKGRTTFIIAHRLSTVANADKIMVMQHGEIIERGKFRELVDQGGLFARLVAEGGFTEPTEVKEKTEA